MDDVRRPIIPMSVENFAQAVDWKALQAPRSLLRIDLPQRDFFALDNEE